MNLSNIVLLLIVAVTALSVVAEEAPASESPSPQAQVVAEEAPASESASPEAQKASEDEGNEDDEDDEEDEGDDDEQPPLSEDQIRKVFKLIDFNGDGKASVHEFRVFAKEQSLLRERKIFDDAQTDPEEAHATQTIDAIVNLFGNYAEKEENRAKLTAADANKDGKINAEEYFQYFHETSDAVINVEAQLSMKKADHDKDGFIDVHEFAKIRSVVLGEAPSEKEKKRHEKALKFQSSEFERLDTDKDQKLSLAEWVRFLSTNRQDERWTATIVAVADSNKDGELDLDELLKSGVLDDEDDRNSVEGAKDTIRDWAKFHAEL
eukprot:TRINITY_DN18873_c0_g1_i2.p1 TRINITY_DN18873_c0_g1~~TRINITY_DN18873_c0_g1_i2.p1  ORF type:complete len:322 (-),score=96.85 TRINITY_DN18873_c0_g1_i2:102-1067(-)